MDTSLIIEITTSNTSIESNFSVTSNNEGGISGVDSFSSIDEQSIPQPTSSKPINNNSKVRKHYSNEIKNKCAQLVASGSKIEDVADEMKIERRRVGEWVKAKDKLENRKNKRSTYKLNCEKDLSQYPLMEAELYKWIVDNRAKGCILSGTIIKLEAQACFKRVYANTKLEAAEFKASGGWLRNFLKRKNLVLRRITTTGRDLPTNTLDTIKEFVNKYHLLNSENPYRFYINGDETAIYLDSPSNYTYADKGIYLIILKSY